jgi:hypothetical protein
MSCHRMTAQELEKAGALEKEGLSVDDIASLFLVERHVVEEALERTRVQRKIMRAAR